MSDQIVLPKHTRFNNLTGKVFSRLTVVSYAGMPEDQKQHLWLCRCECGGEKVVLSGSLLTGNTKSCGCLKPGRKPDDEATNAWKPCGKLSGNRTTLGDRRNRAPVYPKLVEMWQTLLDKQRNVQEHLGAVKQKKKLARNKLIPEELIPQIFSDTSLESLMAEMAAVREPFEESLGYFILSDRIDDLSQSDLRNVLLMCVTFPPFMLPVLRNALSPLLLKVNVESRQTA